MMSYFFYMYYLIFFIAIILFPSFGANATADIESKVITLVCQPNLFMLHINPVPAWLENGIDAHDKNSHIWSGDISKGIRSCRDSDFSFDGEVKYSRRSQVSDIKSLTIFYRDITLLQLGFLQYFHLTGSGKKFTLQFATKNDEYVNGSFTLRRCKAKKIDHCAVIDYLRIQNNSGVLSGSQLWEEDIPLPVTLSGLKTILQKSGY